METEARLQLEKVLKERRSELPLLSGNEWKVCYAKILTLKKTLAEDE